MTIEKMTTAQIAAVKLDKTIHKATQGELRQLCDRITGFTTEEWSTREEMIGEIRRCVLEAREELEWVPGQEDAIDTTIPS